jgi:hypothetical protein
VGQIENLQADCKSAPRGGSRVQSPPKFSEGSPSTRSITSTCAGTLRPSSRSPSCLSTASKIETVPSGSAAIPSAAGATGIFRHADGRLKLIVKS